MPLSFPYFSLITGPNIPFKCPKQKPKHQTDTSLFCPLISKSNTDPFVLHPYCLLNLYLLAIPMIISLAQDTIIFDPHYYNDLLVALSAFLPISLSYRYVPDSMHSSLSSYCSPCTCLVPSCFWGLHVFTWLSLPPSLPQRGLPSSPKLGSGSQSCATTAACNTGCEYYIAAASFLAFVLLINCTHSS